MQPKPSFKAIALLALFLLFLTLLPFAVLSFYNQPVADDFTFAHEAVKKGFLQSQRWWYFNWTGRYTATFLITAGPLYSRWPLGNAFIPLFFLLGFCYSLWYFTRSFGVIGSTGAIIAFALFFTVYVSNLHTVCQAFYWMPSLHTYITGAALFFLFWGRFFRLYRRRSVGFSAYLVLGLLIAVMMGTGEMLIFYQTYIAFGVLLYCYRVYKAGQALALYSCLLSACFGLLSLLAPGNFVRRHFTTGQGIDYFHQASVLLDTFARQLLPHYFFNLPTLLLLLSLALFVSMKTPAGGRRNLTLKPVYIFFFLTGGFLVTFLPQYLANTSEGRAFNFSYLTFLLAASVTVVYASLYYNVAERYGLARLNRPAVALAFFLLAGFVFIVPKNNIGQAYEDLYTGRARCYKAELTARYKYLEQQRGKSFVEVRPLLCQPPSLFLADVTNRVNDLKNDGLQRYFEIDTVLSANVR